MSEPVEMQWMINRRTTPMWLRNALRAGVKAEDTEVVWHDTPNIEYTENAVFETRKSYTQIFKCAASQPVHVDDWKERGYATKIFTKLCDDLIQDMVRQFTYGEPFVFEADGKQVRMAGGYWHYLQRPFDPEKDHLALATLRPITLHARKVRNASEYIRPYVIYEGCLIVCGEQADPPIARSPIQIQPSAYPEGSTVDDGPYGLPL